MSSLAARRTAHLVSFYWTQPPEQFGCPVLMPLSTIEMSAKFRHAVENFSDNNVGKTILTGNCQPIPKTSNKATQTELSDIPELSSEEEKEVEEKDSLIDDTDSVDTLKPTAGGDDVKNILVPVESSSTAASSSSVTSLPDPVPDFSPQCVIDAPARSVDSVDSVDSPDSVDSVNSVDSLNSLESPSNSPNFMSRIRKALCANFEAPALGTWMDSIATAEHQQFRDIFTDSNKPNGDAFNLESNFEPFLQKEMHKLTNRKAITDDDNENSQAAEPFTMVPYGTVPVQSEDDAADGGDRNDRKDVDGGRDLSRDPSRDPSLDRSHDGGDRKDGESNDGDVMKSPDKGVNGRALPNLFYPLWLPKKKLRLGQFYDLLPICVEFHLNRHIVIFYAAYRDYLQKVLIDCAAALPTCELMKPAALQLTRVYFVRFYGEWFRGQIQFESDEFYEILLVDFGHGHRVAKKDAEFSFRELTAQLDPFVMCPAAIKLHFRDVGTPHLHGFLRHKIEEKASKGKMMHFFVKQWNRYLQAYDVTVTHEEMDIPMPKA